MNCKDCIHNEVCHMREICNDIEEQIKKLGCMDFIARADVQEVKHGKWIEDHESFKCSECGCLTDYRFSNFCPYCGAKMDGKVGNEMTPEEAIKTIQVAVAEVEWNYPMDYSVAFETAIEALEKQTPKKPQYVDTRFRHHGRKISDGSSLDKCYKCPNCNSHIFHVFDSEKCCEYCGQALDWRETE